MSFFQNLGKKANEAAQAAKHKADEIAAVTKLNKAVSDENKKIQQAYVSLGQAVYEKFQQEGSIDEAYAAECEKIQAAKAEITKLKDQIMVVQNKKKCENCGTEMAKDMQFCPKCGAKQEMPAEEPKEAAQEQPAQPEGEAKKCSACGADVPSDSEFCVSCGAKMG